MKDPQKFVSDAKSGVVTVEFRKLGSNELRVMPCTLHSESAGQDLIIKNFDVNFLTNTILVTSAFYLFFITTLYM